MSVSQARRPSTLSVSGGSGSRTATHTVAASGAAGSRPATGAVPKASSSVMDTLLGRIGGGGRSASPAPGPAAPAARTPAAPVPAAREPRPVTEAPRVPATQPARQQPATPRFIPDPPTGGPDEDEDDEELDEPVARPADEEDDEDGEYHDATTLADDIHRAMDVDEPIAASTPAAAAVTPVTPSKTSTKRKRGPNKKKVAAQALSEAQLGNTDTEVEGDAAAQPPKAKKPRKPRTKPTKAAAAAAAKAGATAAPAAASPERPSLVPDDGQDENEEDEDEEDTAAAATTTGSEDARKAAAARKAEKREQIEERKRFISRQVMLFNKTSFHNLLRSKLKAYCDEHDVPFQRVRQSFNELYAAQLFVEQCFRNIVLKSALIAHGRTHKNKCWRILVEDVNVAKIAHFHQNLTAYSAEQVNDALLFEPIYVKGHDPNPTQPLPIRV